MPLAQSPSVFSKSAAPPIAAAPVPRCTAATSLTEDRWLACAPMKDARNSCPMSPEHRDERHGVGLGVDGARTGDGDPGGCRALSVDADRVRNDNGRVHRSPFSLFGPPVDGPGAYD